MSAAPEALHSTQLSSVVQALAGPAGVTPGPNIE